MPVWNAEPLHHQRRGGARAHARTRRPLRARDPRRRDCPPARAHGRLPRRGRRRGGGGRRLGVGVGRGRVARARPLRRGARPVRSRVAGALPNGDAHGSRERRRNRGAGEGDGPHARLYRERAQSAGEARGARGGGPLRRPRGGCERGGRGAPHRCPRACVKGDCLIQSRGNVVGCGDVRVLGCGDVRFKASKACSAGQERTRRRLCCAGGTAGTRFSARARRG
mmetsp:Transcript_78/g.226  ORF Transcript_78/g.226 Transcript_78/m.226 type:complete len:224 (-) Transcript_78:164-835(-)